VLVVVWEEHEVLSDLCRSEEIDYRSGSSFGGTVYCLGYIADALLEGSRIEADSDPLPVLA
jgi:hypothetical protein